MENNIIDLKAAKKWSKIAPNIQKLIIDNVFCSKCGTTTIVNYTIYNDRFGVLLKGKCKKCGKSVARLIEDEM